MSVKTHDAACDKDARGKARDETCDKVPRRRAVRFAAKMSVKTTGS
jgi:hypothetical protein